MRVAPGKGSGSFATSKISKGEIVASFGGNVIDQNGLTNYSPDRVGRSLQLNNDQYLLSGDVPEAGDMINHSCEPNCGMAGNEMSNSVELWV